MIEGLLSRHSKVAFHFSGGKDSMACLYLLRDYLPRITVYWVNSGDEFQETIDIVAKCREFIPNFVEINSDSAGWRESFGVPSDLVPTSSSPLGLLMGFGDMKISDRFSCCFSNLMRPMYDRMKADGVTAIIRGQKLVDMRKVPLKSGESIDGFEFCYPVENWTHEEVFSYLRSVDAPIHPCYEFGEYGANCSTCTAWWNESQHKYRQAKHPEIHQKIVPVMVRLSDAINGHIKHLEAFNA